MAMGDEATWQAARAAWPDFQVERERFLGFLGERAPDGQLQQAHANDLYLACACADGHEAALAAFERGPLARLAEALARGSSSDTVAEVLQRVRIEMLVRGADRPPGIVGFRGRSSLASWLLVVGMREAARVEKRARREMLGDDEALWVDVVSSDPELSYLKDVYRSKVIVALKTALEKLPAADLALLRQNLVDGLSIDEIGRREGTHRATAARRLQRAREGLCEAVREELGRRLTLAADEVDELLQLVRSRLDVSVRSLLKVVR
jgi:RNA polymerase sigma-70 factor (ECF subfamily)